ncbi:MAG: Crp/Fnr family transcriptional regulator [Cyanobacteria bacterium J06649_11]
MSEVEIQQFIDNYLAALSRIKISEASIKLLRKKLSVVRVKSRQTLVHPGEVGKNVYLVVSGGFVCRHVHEKTGVAKTINFYLDDLHPVMARVDSFFTQEVSSCELMAITESIIITLPKVLLDVLIKEDPSFARFYYELVITAMVEENEVKTALIAFSSKERYDFIFQEMPSVVQRVPSKYIAEFCGISAEWLSKLKKQKGG